MNRWGFPLSSLKYFIMRSRTKIYVAIVSVLVIAILVDSPIVPVKEQSGIAGGHDFTVWKSPLCWVVGTNPHAWIGFTYVPGARSPLFQSCLQNAFLG